MLKKLDIGTSEIEQVDAFNALVDAVNKLQAQVAILQEHAHPTVKTEPAENTTISKMENVADETLKCPFCNETELEKGMELQGGGFILGCPKCKRFTHDIFWQELIRTRKTLDKGMEHITGLNNMIESWYKLLQSDKDASTKYAILKSAISAYVENKGGDNE